MSDQDPTVAFAGDRNIAVRVLDYLSETDVEIACLLLPDESEASHDEDLLSVLDDLDDDRILRGAEFRREDGIRTLEEVAPDYIVSIHYQYIYPPEVLEIPSQGVVNLHPAYLPYNRGWHTPSWAILDETPYGATLHFMEEALDAGEIIARKRIEIRPDDTADSLYGRALDAGFELFRDTWPELAAFSYETTSQSEANATSHTKDDLAGIQEIDLDESVRAGSLLRKLRALTTNTLEEAAYYEVDDERYRVRVNVVPESEIDDA